jgi:hypothetical protein
MAHGNGKLIEMRTPQEEEEIEKRNGAGYR